MQDLDELTLKEADAPPVMTIEDRICECEHDLV